MVSACPGYPDPLPRSLGVVVSRCIGLPLLSRCVSLSLRSSTHAMGITKSPMLFGLEILWRVGALLSLASVPCECCRKRSQVSVSVSLVPTGPRETCLVHPCVVVSGLPPRCTVLMPVCSQFPCSNAALHLRDEEPSENYLNFEFVRLRNGLAVRH